MRVSYKVFALVVSQVTFPSTPLDSLALRPTITQAVLPTVRTTKSVNFGDTSETTASWGRRRPFTPRWALNHVQLSHYC